MADHTINLAVLFILTYPHSYKCTQYIKLVHQSSPSCISMKVESSLATTQMGA